MANIGDTIQDGSVVWTIKALNDLPTDFNFLTDANDARKSGLYMVNDSTLNSPFTAWGLLLTYNDKAGTSNYTFQVAMLGYQVNINSVMYIRHNAGTDGWSDWEKIPMASEIVDSMSTARNGYVEFGSLLGGLKIQWGSNVAINTTPTNINLPISFTSDTYSVHLTSLKANSGDSTALRYAYVDNVRNYSYFTAASNQNGYYYWFAIGY